MQWYNDQYAATGGDNPQLPRCHVDLMYSWIALTIVTYNAKCNEQNWTIFNNVEIYIYKNLYINSDNNIYILINIKITNKRD